MLPPRPSDPLLPSCPAMPALPLDPLGVPIPPDPPAPPAPPLPPEPPAPRSPYGLSKLEAERLVLETGLRSGMHVCVLRLPLVYGPGLKGNLRAMLDAVARGSFPPPPVAGSEDSPAFACDHGRCESPARKAPVVRI